MARKATRAAAKKKEPAAVQTSESIAEQTRQFLKAGNTVHLGIEGLGEQTQKVVKAK